MTKGLFQLNRKVKKTFFFFPFFRIGDLAKYPFHLSDKGHKIRVEHWDTAIQQGIVAAQNMLNDAANVIYRTIPFFW